MVKMPPTETPPTDATHHAAAIGVWYDEGGAALSPANGPDANLSENQHSKRSVEGPTSLKVDQTRTEEEQILECLGAAVIMRWGTLPTKIQRELFENAASLADLNRTAELKGQIARFLHNRPDDGFYTIKTTPRSDFA